MVRLIDADVVNVNDIECGYGCSTDLWCVEEWFNNLPTVDAVKVVRCKNCEWYDPRADFCTFWDSTRHPEHFCGEGKRRTDD